MTREIQLTRGFIALVDDDDYDNLNKYKWRVDIKKHKSYNIYYASSHTSRKDNPRKQLSMHRLILNAPKGVEVDHINGDGLDNRRCNLRLATKSQNAMNQRKQEGHSSKYKGVCWNKQYNKWQAGIKINGKGHIIGKFDSEMDAARAYDKKALELFGEYVKLNFPHGVDE